MKRFFIAFMAILAVMAFTHGTAPAQISVSAPLLTGCVGNCAPTYSGSFTAPTGRTYTLKSTSSLCPSHTAYAVVRVNGKVVYNGPIGQGTNVSFDSKAGWTVSVFAGTYLSDPSIQCVWQGETNFSVF